MKKLYIQNLAMFVTEKCNLNCAHCCRGSCNNKSMSDEVMENTLEKVDLLGRLSISGGEPTLAVDRIEKIFSYVIDNNIFLESVYTILNGTIYSEKLLKLYDEMNEYIRLCNGLPVGEVSCLFGISYDDFHFESLEERNLLDLYNYNCLQYADSIYFDNLIDIDYPVFKEGNAVNLPNNLTTSFSKIGFLTAYSLFPNSALKMNTICSLGPIVAVNVDGIVTECDASWVNQRTLYNYGSILNEDFESILLRNGAKIIEPMQWEEESSKLLKKYFNY